MLAIALLLAFQDADAWVAAAQAKIAGNDLAGAAADFSRAIEQDPKRVDALIGRGKVRSKLNQLEGARQDLDEAVRLDPASADAWFWRGVLREQTKDLAGAIGDLTRSIETGAKNPVVFLRRATCLGEALRFSEAEADFDRVIGAGHRTFESYFGRGKARTFLSKFAGAVSDLTRARDLEPRNTTILSLRFLAYCGLRSWENASRDLEAYSAGTGGLDDTESLWMWVLRARRGERREATEALEKYLDSARPALPDVRDCLRFLAGRMAESELFASAEGNRARSNFAHYALGTLRMLEGDPARALEQFGKVASDASPTNYVALLARAEVEFVRREEREKKLETLEMACRSMKPFRARIELIDFAVQDGLRMIGMELAVDLPGSRLYWTLTHERVADGKKVQVHVLYDRHRVRLWGTDEKPREVEMEGFFKDLILLEDGLIGDLDRIVAPGPALPKTRWPRTSTLIVQLEPRTAKDKEGMIRVAFGLGRRCATWLRGLAEPDVLLAEEKDSLVFDLPSRNKRLAVDPATGFFRSMRVVNYDGTSREIRVASFEPLERFPDVPCPERFEPAPFDFSSLTSQWKESEHHLNDVIEEALRRWDSIVKEGKEAEVRALLAGWGGRFGDSLHTYALKSLTRQYVRQELDRGVALKELLDHLPRETGRLRTALEPHRAEIRRFLKVEVEALAYRTETAALEAPADSRLHGTLRKLLAEAFQFDRVEELRRKTYGEPLEKILREELEANRQL